MSQASKLHISSNISHDGMLFTYALSGQIDVSAGSTLDSLDKVPQNAQVILDFAAVERVNSMGLAQLMKLLEQWKQAQVSIEVRNLSRMVSMLFKMTGLNRYFVSEQAEVLQQVRTANGATVSSPASSTDQDTPKLRQVHRIRVVKEQHEQSAGSKLQFSVSLQSNQQLTGWYFFNTFLQRRLEKAISVDIKQPGQIAELHENALVFASPFDACALINEHQFIPIARPINDTDEVSIITRKADNRKSMAEFANAAVVTAMQNSFVYLLGRFLCDEYELDSSKLSYSFTGNEIKALQTLLRGQADVLFMLKKNYHELSVLSRSDTLLLTESETAMAYHMLLLSPHYETLKSSLTETVLNLHDDEKGAEVLNDLSLKGWCAPEDDEISMLLMLYNRYVSPRAE
jgi:anti-anti-sigma factor